MEKKKTRRENGEEGEGRGEIRERKTFVNSHSTLLIMGRGINEVIRIGFLFPSEDLLLLYHWSKSF